MTWTFHWTRATQRAPGKVLKEQRSRRERGRAVVVLGPARRETRRDAPWPGRVFVRGGSRPRPPCCASFAPCARGTRPGSSSRRPPPPPPPARRDRRERGGEGSSEVERGADHGVVVILPREGTNEDRERRRAREGERTSHNVPPPHLWAARGRDERAERRDRRQGASRGIEEGGGGDGGSERRVHLFLRRPATTTRSTARVRSFVRPPRTRISPRTSTLRTTPWALYALPSAAANALAPSWFARPHPAARRARTQ